MNALHGTGDGSASSRWMIKPPLSVRIRGLKGLSILACRDGKCLVGEMLISHAHCSVSKIRHFRNGEVVVRAKCLSNIKV